MTTAKIIRKPCPYRHINEDGTVSKVEMLFEKHWWENKFLGFYLRGTDQRVKAVHKDSIVPIGGGKYKIDFKSIRHHCRGKRKRDHDWDDEWQEKNLDGSFAYNGATEDF